MLNSEANGRCEMLWDVALVACQNTGRDMRRGRVNDHPEANIE